MAAAASAESEVHAVAEALRAGVNASDVAAILACWAPDGVLEPPHHASVRGHAEIGAYFEAVFASRRLTFTFTESLVTILGDAALERLSFTATVTRLDGGEATMDVGKGLHVYARQPDGSWKLVLDIWNSDLPSAGSRGN